MSAVTPKLASRAPKAKRALDAVPPPPWLGGRHLARRAMRAAVLIMADCVVLVVFGVKMGGLRRSESLPRGLSDVLDLMLPQGALGIMEFTLAVLLCLILLKAYSPGPRGQVEGRRIIAAAVGIALPAWAALWEAGSLLALVGYLLLVFTLALVLALESRLLAALARLATPSGLRAARVLMIAGHHDIHRARRHPAVSDRGHFVVKGIFDPKGLRGERALEELCEAMRRCQADTILLCCGALGDKAFSVVLDAATSMGCGLLSLGRSFGGAGSEPRLVWTRGAPMIVLASPAVRTVQLLIKRTLDIVGGGFGLLAFTPIMAVIAIAIRLDSSGPILFGHRRVGPGGRPFRCWKFRSMRIDAEQLLERDPVLHAQYVKNDYKLPEGCDPRITRLGRVLRASSLDELPQLWNVLRGDMSLVGPRPIVQDELGQYGSKSSVLLSVKPGLAGAWAVSGRARVGYPHRAEIELGYVRGWRFARDLAILLRTLPAVFSRRGAH